MKALVIYLILVIILPFVLFVIARRICIIVNKVKKHKYGCVYLPARVPDPMEKEVESERPVIVFLMIITPFCGILWALLYCIIQEELIPIIKYKPEGES